MKSRKAVTELDASISADKAQLDNLKGQLADLQDTLNYLKNQLILANEDLRKAYGVGNDANTAVAFAKQNLEAVNQRYQQ